MTLKTLTSLVRILRSDDNEPEDFFADAAGMLFVDDTRNMHGDGESVVHYDNAKLGELRVRLADPQEAGERRLFAQYLWNASIALSERISGLRMQTENERLLWNVEGERVLELGAGAGLSGIVAKRIGAKEVVLTDFPAADVLRNLSTNITENVAENERSSISVHGHAWGEFDDDFCKNNKAGFTRILAADLYWMPWTHKALAVSMRYFLADTPGSCVYVIAGFHTGRDKLAEFFATAIAEGLQVDDIFEEDAVGQRREWQVEAPDRGIAVELKSWLVIARLSKKT